MAESSFILICSYLVLSVQRSHTRTGAAVHTLSHSLMARISWCATAASRRLLDCLTSLLLIPSCLSLIFAAAQGLSHCSGPLAVGCSCCRGDGSNIHTIHNTQTTYCSEAVEGQWGKGYPTAVNSSCCACMAICTAQAGFCASVSFFGVLELERRRGALGHTE